MSATPSRFETFRALHHGDGALLLPNGWDYASIAALVSAGFTTVGTTSLGVAVAAGKPDAAAATLAETMDLARRTAGLCLLTVDFEGGFSEDPTVVAEHVAELAALGVVGLNLEDGRADRELVAPERHARCIATIKQRVPEIFINARTDAYWLRGSGASLDETIHRLQTYAEAGADGLFVPGVVDEAAITAIVREVSLPLNILYKQNGLTLAELSALGVRRVSLGSLLFRESLRVATELAERIRHNRTDRSAPAPSYHEVQALVPEDSGT